MHSKFAIYSKVFILFSEDFSCGSRNEINKNIFYCRQIKADSVRKTDRARARGIESAGACGLKSVTPVSGIKAVSQRREREGNIQFESESECELHTYICIVLSVARGDVYNVVG